MIANTTMHKPATVPDEIVLMLPWHVTGRLDPAERQKVEAALTADTALACHYAAISDERDAAIRVHESLGGPSPGVVERLFAAIDAEQHRKAVVPASAPSESWTMRTIGMSPKTLGWIVGAAVLLLIAQVVAQAFFVGAKMF